jgi:catechol 2,3-dioxygenase-like lactoylglutathione lyase family enzyme
MTQKPQGLHNSKDRNKTENQKEVLGIHHVTAIARNPQKNIDFYTQILGLRLVKLTVNLTILLRIIFIMVMRQGDLEQSLLSFLGRMRLRDEREPDK